MDDAIFIEIQQLCRLVHQRGLRELSVSQPDFSISLTSVPSGLSVVTGVTSPPVAVGVPVQATPTDQPEIASPPGYTIASPLIGIFYRSPSPDAPPFVEVGDTVEVGQTIGIIEAMKVFNEITTEQSGKVIAIQAVNGALVKVDQPLMVIEPSA